MGPIVGMREFIGMLRRRGPVMALILMAGLYMSISYAMTLPRAYEALAVIKVTLGQPERMASAVPSEESLSTTTIVWPTSGGASWSCAKHASRSSRAL